MASFQYRALQSDGTIAEGVIDAPGRTDALRRLSDQGLKPLRLSDAAESKARVPMARAPLFGRGGKVNARALENFTRQLAGLLGAGIPLSRALRIVQREASTPAAREKWKAIYDAVVEGASLARAMEQSPDIFPRVYVAMIEAGETGGFIDVVLNQIADFQAREKELRSRVLSALIYPAVLAGLSLVVLVFLLVFFIPRFQTIFSGFGASLPVLTQMIVSASEFATRYGTFGILLVLAVYISVRKWIGSERGRRKWEGFLLALPVLGALKVRFAMTRFCRMLGTLIGVGVPLIQALRVARESIGTQALVDAVSQSIDRVRQGASLSESLGDCPRLFPGSILEMISVAEESGRLDSELVRLAAMTESDLDRQLRAAVALAEPTILFLMAAFIGTMVVGMLLPIFTIQDLIR